MDIIINDILNNISKKEMNGSTFYMNNQNSLIKVVDTVYRDKKIRLELSSYNKVNFSDKTSDKYFIVNIDTVIDFITENDF